MEGKEMLAAGETVRVNKGSFYSNGIIPEATP